LLELVLGCRQNITNFFYWLTKKNPLTSYLQAKVEKRKMKKNLINFFFEK